MLTLIFLRSVGYINFLGLGDMNRKLDHGAARNDCVDLMPSSHRNSYTQITHSLDYQAQRPRSAVWVPTDSEETTFFVDSALKWNVSWLVEHLCYLIPNRSRAHSRFLCQLRLLFKVAVVFPGLAQESSHCRKTARQIRHILI